MSVNTPITDASSRQSETNGKAAGVGADPGAQRYRYLFELLFEHNPDGIAIATPEGEILANPALRTMVGTSQPMQAQMMNNEAARNTGLFLADGKTPHPADALPLARALRGEHVRDHEILRRSPENPHGVWASAHSAPLPNGWAIAVFRDITHRKELEAELAQRNEELARQTAVNADLIARLRLAVDELSTPVLELGNDILAVPVIGVVDTVRSARMMEKVLAAVVAHRCRFVIIDVTGVEVMDTGTADCFLRIARAIELLGAECIMSGVQPAVAQTLTCLGVGFRGLVTRRSLKHALEFCVKATPEVSTSPLLVQRKGKK